MVGCLWFHSQQPSGALPFLDCGAVPPLSFAFGDKTKKQKRRNSAAVQKKSSDHLMCDEWMPVLQLPLTIEQYHQLPRNPSYKYEYIQGKACLTPRARHYHALLDVASFAE